MIKNIFIENKIDRLLETLIASNSLYKQYSENGCKSFAAEEGREYIMYELLYLLNQLKPLTEEEVEKYLSNTDTVLDEVITYSKEKKGWDFDQSLALMFCRCVVVDYLNYEDSINIDATASESALEQIVGNYEDDYLCDRMYKPWFISFYDYLLDIYADREELKFYYRGEDVLRQLVSHRALLNDICC